VYGKDHVTQHHKGTFYKIKYLKTLDSETNQVIAFPNGLPGFNSGSIKKIHFVGHSMGALTVKYF
jgi:triacylglycerol esterase/lipase EstA (alpha/beta hydrolase family)